MYKTRQWWAKTGEAWWIGEEAGEAWWIGEEGGEAWWIGKKLEGALGRIRELESATNIHKQIEKDDYHDPSVFDDSEILSSDYIPEWYQSSPHYKTIIW